MTVIRLSDGSEAQVDDEDFDWLNAHRWSPHREARGTTYAFRQNRERTKLISMHREIMGATAYGLEVDHLNRDGLNNRKSNLRVVTHGVNQQNGSGWGTSPFRGVSIKRRRTTIFWVARISRDHRMVHLGCFDTEEDAARAYDEAARRLYGPLAFTNFVEGDTN